MFILSLTTQSRKQWVVPTDENVNREIEGAANTMKRISVDAIENDMVLGRDVCGPSGNILIGKGTVINPSMGRRLKNWGILHVFIEGEEEDQQANAATNVSPLEIRTMLEAKFSRCISNPIMQKIFASVYQFRMQKE